GSGTSCLGSPDRKLDIVGAQHHPFHQQGRQPDDQAPPPPHALDRPCEKDFLSTGRHPDAKGILDHFQMSVPAAEKVGGVDAFLEFNFEESHLGQARRIAPYRTALSDQLSASWLIAIPHFNRRGAKETRAGY